MANGALVRRIKDIVDDYDVVVNWRRKPRIRSGGSPLKAEIFFEDHKIVVYRRNHEAFDDMVLSLIHEWVHAVRDDLPEYMIDEGLDRIAFTSGALRWKAAIKLGDASCYGKQSPDTVTISE